MDYTMNCFTYQGYLIRPIRESDASAFYEIVSDERIAKTLGCTLTSVAECERQIRVAHLSFAQKCLPQTLVICKEDTMIGILNVNRMEDGIAELGYFLSVKYWRKGIMKHVLPLWIETLAKRFGVHRFEAYCEVWNEAGKAVLESCGFTYEGRLKELIKHEEQYYDMDLYAKIVH